MKTRIDWVYPHKNEEQVQYKGLVITVAQVVKTGDWSWAVSGEDGSEFASKEKAIEAAKGMVDAITRNWD